MPTAIIITLCVLLLLAYIFDVTSSKTKIPSVILLLALGVFMRQIANFLGLVIPNLSSVLPVLGTVGLILIVLEGSLELELDKSKLPMVGKSSLLAFFPMLALSFATALGFQYVSGADFKVALANAIPFAVISSAIAIPSAKIFGKDKRELVTYESSLSDIFGVLFFNFITLNEFFNIASFGGFFFELLVMLIISIATTLGLSFFLSRMNHHVKYVPIILIVILVYALSKVYHLPSLVFVLIFGLFLGNIDALKHYSLISRFYSDDFEKEVEKFKELAAEVAFAIRALFFLLFGYLMEVVEILDMQTVLWALGIVAGIFAFRAIFLKLFGFAIDSFLFIAPRGLITILLYLSLPEGQGLDIVKNSMVVQVVILTTLIMMVGLVTYRPPNQQTSLPS